MMDQPHDDGLGPWVADAVAAVNRAVEQNPRTVDFDDLMRRANRLDPETVDDTMLGAAGELARVVDIRAVGAASPRAADDALQLFVDDAAQAVERLADERRLGSLGEPPLEPVTAAEASRSTGWIAAGLLLAAVVAGVAFLDVQGLQGAEQTDGLRPAQASRQGESSATHGNAVERKAPKAARPTRPNPPKPEVDQVELVVDEPEPDRTTPARVVAQAPTLDELAGQAERQWREGDLRGATATLQRIVKRGRSSRRAEMAFADLFAIARQRSDTSMQRRMWKRYLAKFPRGRFSDDASAGLCRASSRDGACWSGYLQAFPQGSYRAEAKRALVREADRGE